MDARLIVDQEEAKLIKWFHSGFYFYFVWWSESNATSSGFGLLNTQIIVTNAGNQNHKIDVLVDHNPVLR